MYIHSMDALEIHLRANASPAFMMFNETRDESRLVEINAEMNRIQDIADRANRNLTNDERQEIETLYAEFQDVEARLDDQRPKAAKAHYNASGGGRKTSPDNPGKAITGGGSFQASVKAPGPDGRRYDDMFARAPRHEASKMEPGEFMHVMSNGLHDPRLIRAEVQQEGVGSLGGFEVPTQVVRAVVDGALGQEVFRPRATIYPMTMSNTLTIPRVNVYDRSANVGGITSAWIGEGGTTDLQVGRLTPLTFRACKLMTLVAMSNEVIADSISGGQVFVDLMAAELAYQLDSVFLTGDGVAKPQGVLNADSLIVQPKESGQAADTINYNNVTNMWARLHPACQANAVWYVSTEAVPQLLRMAFDEGATDKKPIFTVAGTASSPTMTLMGRPVIPTEHNPVLGDQGDILLCDPSKYIVTPRQGLLLDRSPHARFMTDEMTFRQVFRVDGRALWPSAITPRSGSLTLSWAVTLEAR